MHCVKVDALQMSEIIEEDNRTIKCLHCKKDISEKPWITVSYPEDEYTVHACNYSCSKNLSNYLGRGYWENVVNKEDFPGPRPVSSLSIKSDITVNFGIDVIRKEIEDENKRISQIEIEYENYDEDLSDSD